MRTKPIDQRDAKSLKFDETRAESGHDTRQATPPIWYVSQGWHAIPSFDKTSIENPNATDTTLTYFKLKNLGEPTCPSETGINIAFFATSGC